MAPTWGFASETSQNPYGHESVVASEPIDNLNSSYLSTAGFVCKEKQKMVAAPTFPERKYLANTGSSSQRSARRRFASSRPVGSSRNVIGSIESSQGCSRASGHSWLVRCCRQDPCK